jgi:hypothetical protein
MGIKRVKYCKQVNTIHLKPGCTPAHTPLRHRVVKLDKVYQFSQGYRGPQEVGAHPGNSLHSADVLSVRTVADQHRQFVVGVGLVEHVQPECAFVADVGGAYILLVLDVWTDPNLSVRYAAFQQKHC